MKAAFLASLVSLSLASTPGTVGIDIFQQRTNSSRSRGNNIVRSRMLANFANGDTVPESLVNGFQSYSASLYIGSDQQLVTPAIDTGSSDLWVMLASNKYCGTPDFNCTGQTFNPNTSTTWTNLSEPFVIRYLDTTGAFGNLSTDNIRMGDITVDNATFAVATIANSSEAVFGIGYVGDEATIYSANRTYDNIPVTMKKQGLIERVAYSLYLNGIPEATGQVLFGGVDHAKYSGELGLVPLVNTNGGDASAINEFTVMLHGISIRSNNVSCPLADIQLPVLLDSGTSYALLPSSVVESIGESMNYTYNSTFEYYTGNCNQVFDYDSLELNFSGIKLQVPPATLLDNLTLTNGDNVFINGEQQCILAVDLYDDLSNLILGDVFMRNFYIVYDLESNQVALAQTRFNETDQSDVEVISSAIPSAVTAPLYSKTQFIFDISTYTNYASCEVHSSSVFSSSVQSSSSAASSGVAPRSTPTSSVLASSGRASSNFEQSSNATASVTFSSASVISALAFAVDTATAVSTKYTTIECSTPATFEYNGQTYTVTEATTLTVEDCGCTATPSSVSPSKEAAPSATETKPQGPEVAATATVVSTAYTTIECSTPTTLTYNGATYTVTEATTLTIEDCSCTATTSSEASSKTSPEAGPEAGSEASSEASPKGAQSSAIVSSKASSGTSATAEAVASSQGIPVISSSVASVGPTLVNGASKLSIGGAAGLALVLLLI